MLCRYVEHRLDRLRESIAMRPVFKPTIKQYNSADYDVLRGYLIKHIGAYCSYCEAPISNDSAVEHKVPKNTKRGFPKFATQWRNLLIACHSCNSAKEQRPYRVDAFRPRTEEDFFLNTMKHWVWPDRTDSMLRQPSPPPDNPYALFAFDYSKKSQVDLNSLHLVRSSSIQPTMSWATTKYEMVWVVPNSANVKPGSGLESRVLSTIQGLNLNYYNADDRAFNDRRVINRTNAMMIAQASLRNLEGALVNAGKDPGRPEFSLMAAAVRESIIAIGFWSVWFSVFRAALDAPAAPGELGKLSKSQRFDLLDFLLVHYIDRPSSPEDLIFPGTDVDQLNLSAFV